MRVFNKKSATIATLLLMAGPAYSSAYALENETTSQTSAVETKKELVTYEFSEGVSVDDAYKYGVRKGHTRFSMVYENGGLGGGRTLESLQQAQEFRKNFKSDHSVEPRIIRIEILQNYSDPAYSANKANSKKANKHKVETKKEGLSPVGNSAAKNISKKVETHNESDSKEPTVNPSVARIADEPTLVSTAATAPLADSWSPEWVGTKIENRPSSVLFSQQSQYGSTTQLSSIEAGFGLEMEVNLHADPAANLSGKKPLCENNVGVVASDSYYFAKNNDYFNYNLYAGGGDLSKTKWYLDYNDLSDNCDIQSIALGIVEPQKLATIRNPGVDTLSWNIETPKGTTPKNTVTSLWQLVENGTCLSPAGSLMNPTDCMGLNTSRNPSQPARQISSLKRNLKGPAVSWHSDYHGHFGGVNQRALVSSTAPIAGEQQLYLDIDSKNSLYHSLKWAKDRQVLFTNSAVNFNMNDPMRRDLMAVYLYRLKGSPAYTKPSISPANDVTTTQSWYKEISWAISNGYLPKDSAGNFRAASGVTRAELANAMYKAAGSPAYTPRAVSLSRDVSTTHPYYKAIDWGLDTGVVPTAFRLGNYQPTYAVSRADTFFTLYAFGHR